MPRKKSDLRRMSVYLFPDVWDKCGELAALERIPVAMIVRRALTEYIERVERKSRDEC